MHRAPHVVLKEAADALAELAEIDPHEFTDAELEDAVIELARQRNVVDAALTKSVAVFDARQGFELEGAKSMSAWLAWKCRIRKGSAVTTCKNARALRHMPVTEAAFLAGTITADHVAMLVGARGVNPDAFANDEAMLVDWAGQFRFGWFVRVVKYWRYRVAAEAEEAAATTQYDSRELHCSETFDGAVALEGVLDAVGGATFAAELRRLERELFEADWAEARERVGPGATAADLCRTGRQRLADALVEMARRSAAKPEDWTDARPLITVLIGDESLADICELSTGTVVTPGQVLPLLNDCDIERVVFDGPSRVIDVGVRRRFFAGATRRAIEVRDRTCSHPSCDVPADQYQIDHIKPHEQGGLTTQANGRGACGHHNRWYYRTQQQQQPDAPDAPDPPGPP